MESSTMSKLVMTACNNNNNNKNTGDELIIDKNNNKVDDYHRNQDEQMSLELKNQSSSFSNPMSNFNSGGSACNSVKDLVETNNNPKLKQPGILVVSNNSSSSSVSISSQDEPKNIQQQQQQLQQITKQDQSIKYGELILIGYNGCISTKPVSQVTLGDEANVAALAAQSAFKSKRRLSKFILKPREKPNGVKPDTQHSCQTNQEIHNLMLKNDRHSVTYTLSRNHAVVVQYTKDETTDMFQIGRSTESAIDFIVLDTVIPLSSKDSSTNSAPPMTPPSTISRYSCRIVVERNYPYTARIYAAGFDLSKRIFLGEKATKWKNEKGELDGVTTNGVLIMHPSHGFTDQDSDKLSNEWMEVSVCGSVFSLNESRLKPCLATKQMPHSKQSNILRDGTLIDLCGATLVWRSVESLERTPNKRYLEMNLDNLNKLKPQCPVGFKTLVFPSSASPIVQQQILINRSNTTNYNNNHNNNNKPIGCSSSSSSNNSSSGDRTPMVYLKCGHVHGQHNWGVKKDNERECPLCRKIGPYVQLVMGLEPSLYCDNLKINDNSFKPYAFIPCGHMASDITCKFWSKILVPQGVNQGLCPICPFCAVPLCREQPFVKLIFQEGL